MSYETVEDSLKDQLLAIDPKMTVVLNDATKIQSGSQKIAILKYGSFSQVVNAYGEHSVFWEVEIELYCRYINDADTRNNLRDLRNSVINRVNQYPKLGGSSGVFDAMIVRGSRLEETVAFGSFRYLGELVVCQVQEDLEVEYQE